ncbi:hypothetical protein KPL78_12365 [Roseomonas sp. HJA6]|uniref:Uncharacterized protein n=1 Tax=Roseomonas alba TaxID=2846776 RepID=A0ABS7A8M5_9PROT|nr:hypothetical protein [Neoroseomonas alba]MBW6398650.1 hypothetical protein [Neoroseomonas alba]
MSFLERIGEDAVGVGVYTLPQAARLARLRLATVEDLVGPEAADAGQPRSAPIVIADVGLGGSDKVVTFLGLLELWAVAEMRHQGVPMKVVRRVAFEARRILKVRHPLASVNFRTDGRRVFMALRQDGKGRKPKRQPKVVLDILRYQHAMEEVLEQSLRQEIVVRSPDGAPVLWYPLGLDKRVVLDPHRRFGEPIDPKSGVPTSALAQALHAEKGDADAVAFWFGVDREAVFDATAFETWLASR